MAFKIKNKVGRPRADIKMRSLDNPLIKPKGDGWIAYKFDKKNQKLFYKKVN